MWLASVACGLLLWVSGVNAAINNGAPIKLTGADRSELEDLACKSRYNLAANKVNAFRFSNATTTDGTSAKRILALVECKAHDEFNGKPIHYIDDCDLIDNRWLCSQPQLEIPLEFNGRTVKMRPWGLTPERAQHLLTSIAKLGYFQGESLDKAIGSSCDVSNTKDPEVMELQCDAVIGVSFWCPQQSLTGCPRVLFVNHN